MEGKMQPIRQPLPPPAEPRPDATTPPAARGPAAPPLAEFVIDDIVYTTMLTRKYRQRRAWRPVDPHLVVAAIPGQILQLNVKVGDRVARGQSLLVLEAMKMQNQILAPLAGTVVAIAVQAGQKVAKGELMIELRD
jgi:glutaconyl-CoA/methylmalonyl-CoA decarboxylase subunit gamma